MTQSLRVPPVQRVHSAWWTATAAALAIISAGAFMTVPGLLMGPLHTEFHWSHGTIGLAASVNMTLNGLSSPFGAALMDRFGIRRVVATALGVITAGAVLTTTVSAPWQLVLYWGVLVGLGGGCMATAFAALVAQRWFVRRRGLVTGVLSAANVLGQFTFLPLLSWIVERYEWRAATLAVAAAALCVLPIAWLFLRDHPADAGLPPYGSSEFVPKPAPVGNVARRSVRVLLESARTIPFWLLALTFAICGASTNGVMWTHFTPAAHEHGMPLTVASGLLVGVGLFNMAGTTASGWLTDRFDPRRLLAVYYFLRAFTLLALPWLLGPTVQPLMLGFVVAFGVLDLATVPPTVALCRRFYGDDASIVFGWVVATHQAGAAAVAFLGGLARDTFDSYDPVWVGVAALCVFAAVLATRIRG